MQKAVDVINYTADIVIVTGKLDTPMFCKPVDQFYF